LIEWDAELARHLHPAPLLQSWAWGEVQARAGWTAERVRLSHGLATVLTRGWQGVRHGYVPRGPVPPRAEVLDELADWARERRLTGLRLDPETGPELGAELVRRGFRRAAEVQPAHTLIVELAEPEALLASFKPKWRYNIRLADRRGVAVEEGKDAEALAGQAAQTAAREGISLPTARYYRTLLACLPTSRTYVARLKGEALAAILVASHDGRAYYLFGGSSGKHRDAMPNHALQWRAMQDAYSSGCRDYDLWGVPPPAAGGQHPWAGIGKFKEGFGGRRVEYVGTWELVLSPLRHRLGEVAEQARRRARVLRRVSTTTNKFDPTEISS
jgi:lipid II:glycine glycyltransferase (peptidoglycan interpeptide bridge formation enzyme)